MFSQVGVCHSVHRGSRVSLVAGPFLVPGPMSFPGVIGYLRDRVSRGCRISRGRVSWSEYLRVGYPPELQKWVVCILLECFLVLENYDIFNLGLCIILVSLKKYCRKISQNNSNKSSNNSFCRHWGWPV